MSLEYPDVLGDLVDARQRFENTGLHYQMVLQPATIAPGETTVLRTWLQSCWDVPAEASITIHLPGRPPPPLTIIQITTRIPLETAEVGEVCIPIASDPAIQPGEYRLSVTTGVNLETRGLHVRAHEHEGYLADTLLSFTTGLGLASTMVLGYDARRQSKQELPLRVEGTPQPSQEPDLTPTYLPHWTLRDMPIQGKALRYVNDQRLHLLPKITRSALYSAFLQESQDRLGDAGLALHIGEALFLAKMLTYAAEYFLRRSDWQDAILIPAYSLAFRHDLLTDDPVMLICRADYPRMARLAISLSFGLLHRHLGRAPWTLEEQLAVAGLVAERVERGGFLPAEFVYLPLLLGGILVANQVQMPGEEPAKSLDLLGQAYQKRAAELAENPELAAIFQALLRQALSSA
jgi:hypothetical protein